MKKIKRVLVLILSLIMTVSLVSCSNDKKENERGRYLEEVYTIPSEISYPMNMKLLDNDEIALLGQNEDATVLYYFISSDKGKSWNKKYEVTSPAADDGGSAYFGSLVIKDNGELVLSFVKQSAELIKRIEDFYNETNLDEEAYEAFDEEIKNNSEYIVKVYDKDGNEKESNIDINNMKEGEIRSYDNEVIIRYNYTNETLSQIDKDTFNVIKDLQLDGSMGNYTVVGNDLIINNYEKIDKYNLETDKKEEIKELEKYIYEINELFSGDNALYFKTEDGFYRYSLKDKKVKKLIDNQLSTLGQGDFYMSSFIELGKEEFLVLGSGAGEENSIIHFTYDKNAKSKPDEEITIYSLYEDYNIKQAINKYQKDHEDIYINYETGIEYEEGNQTITESDAIKALNTKIASNKGPDILILDGLPVDSYSDKGLLEDISGIINKNKDSFFTNIYDAYKKKGDKIYAFPLNIEVPTITSSCYDVSKITDLKTLADAVEELSSNKERRVLDVYNPTQLLYYLYYSCSASWVNKDNSLNEDNIKEFLECAKRIYEANDKSISDKERSNQKELLEEVIQYSSKEEYDTYSVYGGDNGLTMVSDSGAKLSIGYVYGPDEISMYEGCMEKNSNANYNMWNGQISGYFLPSSIVGISAKSKHKDMAKDFVSLLMDGTLLEDSYSHNMTTNKTLLLDQLDVNGEENGTSSWGFSDGETDYTVECKPLSEEQKGNLVKLIENAKSPALIDKTILKKIQREMESYILGEENLDNTITAINNKLDIYLSE